MPNQIHRYSAGKESSNSSWLECFEHKKVIKVRNPGLFTFVIIFTPYMSYNNSDYTELKILFVM